MRWGGRPQLRIRLRAGRGHGHAGPTHRHCLERLHDLRRRAADHLARVQRLRQRGHRLVADEEARLLDDGHQREPGGGLAVLLVVLGRGRCQLRHHRHPWFRHGQNGSPHDHGLEWVHDLRQFAAGRHRRLQRLQERRQQLIADAAADMLYDAPQRSSGPGIDLRLLVLGRLRRQLRHLLRAWPAHGETRSDLGGRGRLPGLRRNAGLRRDAALFAAVGPDRREHDWHHVPPGGAVDRHHPDTGRRYLHPGAGVVRRSSPEWSRRGRLHRCLRHRRLLRHGRATATAAPTGARLLARGIRRWHLHLWFGDVPRFDRQPPAPAPGRGHHADGGPGWVLAGRLRRRDFCLRRRGIPRLHSRAGPWTCRLGSPELVERAHRRHGALVRRGRLLHGGLRRGCVRLR